MGGALECEAKGTRLPPASHATQQRREQGGAKRQAQAYIDIGIRPQHSGRAVEQDTIETLLVQHSQREVAQSLAIIIAHPWTRWNHGKPEARIPQHKGINAPPAKLTPHNRAIMSEEKWPHEVRGRDNRAEERASRDFPKLHLRRVQPCKDSGELRGAPLRHRIH